MKIKKRTLFFKTKLLIMVAGVIILNTFITGMLYYRYAYASEMKAYKRAGQDTAEQVSEYLSQYLSEITIKINALNNNVQFYSTVLDYIVNRDNSTYGKCMGDIADYLYQISSLDKMIDSVYLYTDYGDFDNFVNIKNPEFSFKDSVYYDYFSTFNAPEAAYFPATTEYVFKTVKPVIPIVYMRRIGNAKFFFCVAINTQKLKDYLFMHYKFDNIYITDKYTNIFCVGDNIQTEFIEKAKAADNVFRYEKNSYIVSKGGQMNTGWQVYTVSNMETLNNSLSHIKILTRAEFSLAACIVIIIGILFTNGISSPLMRLTEMMKSSGSDKFTKRFNYKKDDEIGMLADGFNEMSDEINSLVRSLNQKIMELEDEKEKLKAEQEMKRIAQLKVLRAQINPHFLYNTLNTISWQAASVGAKDASRLSTLLGRFFQSSLSRGEEYVTVSEEHTQVYSYLEIQKIRYGKKLDFTIELPEEIMDCYVVHLSLQPLVENAIYHGIKEVERQGKVLIYADKCEINNKQCIRFVVEDNGKGIDEQKLEYLNKQLKSGVIDSSVGYGIFNVNERIQLSYGKEYGLHIESEYESWTKSVLIMPYMVKKPEYSDNKEV